MGVERLIEIDYLLGRWEQAKQEAKAASTRDAGREELAVLVARVRKARLQLLKKISGKDD